ncbi:MAG: alpha/beta hydrolase [Anaerolineaceae bacterium]|nr:alpha/beta hydrolase [Anaerolineaceae bacterium]
MSKIRSLILFATILPGLTFTSLSCSAFTQPANVPTTEPQSFASTPAPTLIPDKPDITYCTADNVELKMDMYYPTMDETSLPVVVYVHGGGWTSGDKTRGTGIRFIPTLIERGFLVVAINYRLSPEYKFPAHIEDVKCAIRHLRAEAETYNLDPDRIGAIGSSAGGHLVSLLGVTDESAGMEGSGGYLEYSSRVQAVIDISGPDPTLFCADAWVRQIFGAEDIDAEIISLASPLVYISNDDPPFLILHGELDELVTLEQSQVFRDSLTTAGVTATLQVVSNADHGFKQKGNPIDPSYESLIQMAADFFDQHLKYN